MAAPVASSPANLFTAVRLRNSASPPPGTMPSSMAALVTENSILDAVLLLFQFDLGGCADLDNGDAARDFTTLLQFLTVPVGIGVFDLTFDLSNASLDVAAEPAPS